MFSHIFFNRLKILLRNKSIIFWSLIFPIALGTFFNMAFSNLNNEEKFKVIDVAVVSNEELNKEMNFKILLNNLSEKNDDQIFNINYVDKEKEAKDLLDNNKVSAYIIVKDKINVGIKSNGINQTIVKYIVDDYYQTNSVINNVIRYNPEVLRTGIDKIINSNNDYFKDENTSNTNFIVIYFYTLLGMVCIYAGFFGIDAVNNTEANLSKRGARISVSPTHKLKVLLISLLVGLIIQFTENLILLAYLYFVLGVSFGSQTLYIILLLLVGSFAGITLGTLIGASNNKNERTKASIHTTITMTCSFLAGMMVVTMRYIIEQNAPFINRMNPVAMITDALYSLYYYDTLNRYYFNIINLLLFSLVMIILSYIFIRRKKYDNI